MIQSKQLIVAASAAAVVAVLVGVTLAVRSPGSNKAPAAPGEKDGSSTSDILPRPTSTVWDRQRMESAEGITITPPESAQP